METYRDRARRREWDEIMAKEPCVLRGDGALVAEQCTLILLPVGKCRNAFAVSSMCSPIVRPLTRFAQPFVGRSKSSASEGTEASQRLQRLGFRENSASSRSATTVI